MPSIHFVDGQAFHPDSGEVRRGDCLHRLEPQPAALLALLAERAGTVVTHAEIARHLWPEGTHVDFRAGVHYAVGQIRLALDEAPRGRIIETLPRRGYRLRAAALPGPVAPAAPAPSGAVNPWRRRIGLAVAAAAVVAAVAVVERRPNDHHARVVALLTTLHDLVY